MRHYRLFLAGLVLFLIALLAVGDRKTIHLSIDQVTQDHTTFTLTTAQFLRSLGIPVTPDDRLVPDFNSWLHNGENVRLDHAAQVLIWADDRLHRLATTSRVPADWLSQASLEFAPGDQLLLEGSQISTTAPLPYQPVYSVVVSRSVSIKYADGNQEQTLQSTAVFLAQALWKAGLELRQSDLVSLPLETGLQKGLPSAGLQVIHQRGKSIQIQVDGKSLSFESTAMTVGEALAAAHIAIQGLDYSKPPVESPLPTDGMIRVVRVQETLKVEEAPVPFETEYQPLPDVELDTQKMVQAGEYGVIARRVRIRFEDGKEVSRQADEQWQAVPPKPRILGYGTKAVMHTLNTPSGKIQYWRVLTMWVTSYHPSTGGGKLTATGQLVKKGIIAVNPHYISYGTRMYVPGYGIGEASDTGDLGTRWIDLGYSDSDYVPWHQYVQIYFLWPPPANILYNYPP